MAAGSGFGPDDVMYCAMPMFHGNALNTCVVPAIAAGAGARAAPALLGLGVPPRRPALRRHVLQLRGSGPGLRPGHAARPRRRRQHACASASAPTAPRRTSRPSSAASPVPSSRGTGRARGRSRCHGCPGTPRQAMGKPPPGTDVVIVDPSTGLECPPAMFDAEGKLRNASEAIGEIVSRDGVSRFEGYYANDEADAERTRDGWFWSGDLGYRDEEGFFYFAGRTADWLRVDGENFAAAPVERILARFPGRGHGRGPPRPRSPYRRPGHGRARADRPRRLRPRRLRGLPRGPERPRDEMGARVSSASPHRSRSRAPARSTSVRCGASTGGRPTPCGGAPSGRRVTPPRPSTAG